MSQPDPDARLYAADRTIALIGAMGYLSSEFPEAELQWGDENVPLEPDDLDQVWREAGAGAGGDRWIAVTAVYGNYGPAERSYDWGQRVLAGTRDYLWFAIGRLRQHGHVRLASAIEAGTLAGRRGNSWRRRTGRCPAGTRRRCWPGWPPAPGTAR